MARYRADGIIEFLGRLDHQVKVRGFRIEPGEIEAAIIDHPQIHQCVVVARQDEAGYKRLLAYLVAVGEDLPSTGEIRGFLEKRLPAYMLPSALVVLASLPLTPNGKVDRKALPEPDPEQTDLEVSYVAPRSPIEEVLLGIWCDVLKLKAGIHDNFFDLGGHSLLATQVISRLRNAFQVQLPLRSLFEYPTIAGLAIQIIQSQDEITDPDELALLLDELEGSAPGPVSRFKEIEDERDE
jgi:acyl carrier protein